MLRWAKVIKLRSMRIEKQSPEATRRMLSVMTSMMIGIAPDEDEAHVRGLRELTNGIVVLHQPYYKRGTAVANPSPTYYVPRFQKSRASQDVHYIALCSMQVYPNVYVFTLLELVWLIHYEVLLAYLSQIQWNLSCHVIPGWWTYDRNL